MKNARIYIYIAWTLVSICKYSVVCQVFSRYVTVLSGYEFSVVVNATMGHDILKDVLIMYIYIYIYVIVYAMMWNSQRHRKKPSNAFNDTTSRNEHQTMRCINPSTYFHEYNIYIYRSIIRMMKIQQCDHDSDDNYSYHLWLVNVYVSMRVQICDIFFCIKIKGEASNALKSIIWSSNSEYRPHVSSCIIIVCIDWSWLWGRDPPSASSIVGIPSHVRWDMISIIIFYGLYRDADDDMDIILVATWYAASCDIRLRRRRLRHRTWWLSLFGLFAAPSFDFSKLGMDAPRIGRFDDIMTKMSESSIGEFNIPMVHIAIVLFRGSCQRKRRWPWFWTSFFVSIFLSCCRVGTWHLCQLIMWDRFRVVVVIIVVVGLLMHHDCISGKMHLLPEYFLHEGKYSFLLLGR